MLVYLTFLNVALKKKKIAILIFLNLKFPSFHNKSCGTREKIVFFWRWCFDFILLVYARGEIETRLSKNTIGTL